MKIVSYSFFSELLPALYECNECCIYIYIVLVFVCILLCCYGAMFFKTEQFVYINTHWTGHPKYKYLTSLTVSHKKWPQSLKRFLFHPYTEALYISQIFCSLLKCVQQRCRKHFVVENKENKREGHMIFSHVVNICFSSSGIRKANKLIYKLDLEIYPH